MPLFPCAFPKRSSARAFLAEDDGSTTIEFALWLPVMLSLLLAAFQGSILLTAQGFYGSLAADTARIVARHGISAEDAQAQLLATWTGVGTPRAQVVILNGMVTVSIAQEASEIVSFNVLGLTDGFDIAAEVVYAMEPM